MASFIPVKVLTFSSETSITPSNATELFGDRFPLVLRGLGVGPCVSKWTPEYLLGTVDADKSVKVHKSLEPRLNFLQKNFTYVTIPFRQLVDNCLKDKDQFWYLRSLGEDPRGKDVSDLSKHFPELFKDLNIPKVFSQESFFSSVFRISSPSLQLWTHYDMLDNILIQIRGRKRVVLFPPWDSLNLYLEGDKSLVLDIDNPDLEKFPDWEKVTKYEAFLEEGDIIFIPALWFHNITALNFSISVNVFWKNLEEKNYDKKDTYGNKDVVPAQLAFKTFEKATTQLKSLPQAYEDFYLRRMIISIQKRLSQLSLSVISDSDTAEENLQD